MEGNIDMNMQVKIKTSPGINDSREPATISYSGKLFNDPSGSKKSARIDLNDKELDNFRFCKVNSLPTIQDHLTAKFYVDEATFNGIDEQTLVRKNKTSDFNNLSLYNNSL